MCAFSYLWIDAEWKSSLNMRVELTGANSDVENFQMGQRKDAEQSSTLHGPAELIIKPLGQLDTPI